MQLPTPTSGAIVGGAGGSIAGAAIGALVSAGLKGAVSKVPPLVAANMREEQFRKPRKQ